MLRKIDIAQLRTGMFIHELDCGWMAHPFVRSRFRVDSPDQIARLRASGIRAITIDCARGQAVDDAPSVEEARAATEAAVTAIAAAPAPAPLAAPRLALAEELDRAAAIRRRAANVVRTVMRDARLGKAVSLDTVAPVVESVTASILRNAGALVGLSVIKDKDDYTFLHSVSVCTLLVAFCRARGLDAATTYEAGIGGLLHDTGKALVPDAILNKAGSLTDAEFEIVRRHPRDGYDILRRTPGIGAIPLDITLHHHERRDGTGYPDRLPLDGIGELARMAAIVDVYDAITADRCYRKGMPPAQALRKMYEWSAFHLDAELVREFIRCVGIYPVGTLVLLESGLLGVVIALHDSNLLTPKVNVFYSTRRRVHVKPYTVDLARPAGHGGADRIVSHEPAEKWQVDPLRFMTIA
ncbi:HD-GYP domain-containing protein [uncultured Massilia sp.]|uniref:HD-GYP domain-containing protein n=1 Tax=uncultured Massilia sp. TaxID=169973 RepID=UPI0025F24BE2|nr:HD-GYP domain-containing protein [uncultured Massilia sp.]